MRACRADEIVGFFEKRGMGTTADNSGQAGGQAGELAAGGGRAAIPSTVAQELALAAYARAVDRTRVSPFVRRGVEAGCLDAQKVAAGQHCGGKMDDITVIISQVRL